MMLVENPIVTQQQPKSFQCLSQPQTMTVNNQLRTKRSSDFVTLRSKVQQLHLLHTVSCGQKRHAKNRTALHPTCHTKLRGGKILCIPLIRKHSVAEATSREARNKAACDIVCRTGVGLQKLLAVGKNPPGC